MEKNSFFVNNIRLNRDKIETFKKYPFSVNSIKSFEEIKIEKPVTF